MTRIPGPRFFSRAAAAVLIAAVFALCVAAVIFA